MAKVSPVYRGDDPGFQTQAVGAYPIKSDVADKDNIYLSDQGWVYRHFKNATKTEWWDEVIWAGDVTNPPSENDPVDQFGDPTPEFLFGDGYQPTSGPYPGIDATIGAATISPAAAFKQTAFEKSLSLPVNISIILLALNFESSPNRFSNFFALIFSSLGSIENSDNRPFFNCTMFVLA